MKEARDYLKKLKTRKLREMTLLDSLGEWQWVDLFADNGYEMLMRALQACADSIGATLLAKRSWLPKISTPPAKSGKPIIPEVPVASKKDQPEVVTGDAEAVVDTRRPEVPPKPKKEPIKLKTEYVIAIIGAVATMIAAIIGSPLIGRIFSQSPEPAATATYQLQALPTDTLASVIKTDTPSPILTTTKTLTPAPTALPLVITDVKRVEMVLVSEGKFMMGSDSGENNEKPPHEVVLDAYYIDKYEVTNALYKECVHAGACYLPTDTNEYNNSQYAQHPVVYVDWNMAAFIDCKTCIICYQCL